MSYKTIQDTIHGSVKFSGPFLKLLNSPEIQRLSEIKQLGLTKLVFPGANHTRLEHSIGAYHVAEKMANSLDLDDEEKDLVKAAAFLHDIGHAPFSHTLEAIIADRTSMDHMDITKEQIKGERVIEDRDVPSIPTILEESGISPDKVADLIKGEDESEHVSITDYKGKSHDGQRYFGEERYLYQMINGAVDVDQLDYLLRDSHYTGAAHGIIDIERLLQTAEIYNGNLVISKGGVPAVEGMLVARGLMYSSVYFHKTCRIAELMLSKAVESVETEIRYKGRDIHQMTDWELLCFLKDQGGFSAKIVDRLKFRRLYKRCFSLTKEEFEGAEGLPEGFTGRVKEIKELESDIAQEGGLDERRILVDVPHEELKLSEPRLKETGVKILDDGKLSKLYIYSPLARALQKRDTQTWVMLVSCPPEERDRLGKIAQKEIMGR